MKPLIAGLVLMLAGSIGFGLGRVTATGDGQCDPTQGAVVAVGRLQAGTPYPVPTEAVGGSYALVEGSVAGTPVVVLAPCP